MLEGPIPSGRSHCEVQNWKDVGGGQEKPPRDPGNRIPICRLCFIVYQDYREDMEQVASDLVKTRSLEKTKLLVAGKH